MNLAIETHSLNLKSKGNCDIIDITNQVQEIISHRNFSEGSVLIFVVGSTAALTTIEYEPGLLKDYPQLFNKLIPENQTYHHDQTWHDGNGHSHLRASLQKASLTVPFKNGRLLVGTWQQIIFVDFDNRPRNREIIIQILGNKK
jgi:secondary thiamine-phosphate synthase enzyme